MSDISTQSRGQADGPFNARTMLVITAIGALAFIAMLVLGAYAPDLRTGRNGGSHALSNAATGFSGIVRLARETDRNPTIVRVVADLRSENLAVITPADATANLTKILAIRGARPTLIILPKWRTAADETHPGWVRVLGLAFPQSPEGVLAPDFMLKVARAKGRGEALVNKDPVMSPDVQFRAPAVIQTTSGSGVRPMITTPQGGIVLGSLGTRNLYVLSDPDLLNNHGIGSQAQARAALALLDTLNSTGADGVLFDVTANGLGRSRSPLKLAFDAPFLGVTLIIFAAMLLAAWQATVRFGPARHSERAIAFGKAALVDNSAALVRKAGREARFGARYVDVIRNRAIALFRLPPALDEAQLAARLETLNPRRSFVSAANAATGAQTRDELLHAAQSLNQWLKEVQ